MCALLSTCDKISSTDTSRKLLYRLVVTEPSTKEPNNQVIIKKYSQLWAVKSDQFSWESRTKLILIKPSKQSLWSSTDETYDFSHCI